MSTDLVKGLKITCAPTGFRFAPTLDLSVRKLPAEPGDSVFNDEYMLKMTVGVRFSCNQASYSRARENAERQLVNFVYNGLITRVQEARNAIFSGNAQEALAALDLLESEYLR